MRWWLFFPLALSCHKAPPVPEAVPAPTTPSEVPVSFTAAPTEDGLQVRLYDADAGAPDADRLARPAVTPLDAATTASLLGRLPPLEADPADTTALALRQGPTPPPRTGASVQTSFPGTPAPAPEVATGPVTVLRKAPVGEVPLAPHLSISFSQPMVALTSQDEAAKQVPVQLSPAVPGQWRWLGTQTLVFEPTTRFPMATEFTATVVPGTRSATGQPLDGPTTWTFGTPAPSLVASGPGGPDADAESQPLRPTIWLAFDQRVDPAAVLPSLALTVGKAAGPALRLATAAEVAQVAELASGAYAADRVVAAVPVEPLPYDSAVTVTLAAGAPSAEGPRRTPAPIRWTLRTHGPLKVTGKRCGWEGCRPGDAFEVDFSNVLDPARFDPDRFTLTPAVPGMQVTQSGASVWVNGDTRGHTSYTLTVPAGLTDEHGQTLGKDTPLVFEVGAAERQLTGPGGSLVVADPAAPPAVSIWTVNERSLRVTVNRVTPADWARFGEWMDDDRRGAAPGTQVANLTVPVAVDVDNRVETRLDLAPYLKDGLGHFLVQVHQTTPPREEWRRQSWIGWVQVTRIGLTAFVDRRRVLGWVNDLATGAPIADVEVGIRGDHTTTGRSGADGLARVDLPEGRSEMLVATRGADTAFVPASPYPSRWAGWHAASPTPGLRWYLASDRGLYRPGEKVKVKGWARVADGADVALPAPLPSSVRWSLRSSIGNLVAEGTAPVSATAAIDLAIDLPATPDLGPATLLVEPVGHHVGAAGAVNIDIQEFRRPEFEVTADAGEGPWTLGEDAVVHARAAYYAGGALPAAPVRWEVRAEPASFVPPGQDGWSFGVWTPWWHWFDRSPAESTTVGTWETTTDAAGVHHLGVHFESLRPARPMLVTAQAAVSDVNRQTMTASTRMLVHPSSLYVGLKAERLFVEKGQPVEVRARVVDRAGAEAREVPAELTVVRSAWAYRRGTWATEETTVATCTLVAARGEPICRFVPEVGGEYLVRGQVRDAQGRPNLTEIRVWVAGAEDTTPDRGVVQEEVTLVPDRAEVAPGGKVALYLRAPFSPAEGVMTVRSGGIVLAQPVHLEGPSTTLHLDVPEAWIPEVSVTVDLVGAAPRKDDAGKVRNDLPARVAWASGSIRLQVPAAPRTLGVDVAPAERTLDPGGTTPVVVTVTDAAGAPVRDAELVIAAVDESVLALAGYSLPDPLAIFYTSRGDDVSAHHLREWVTLADPRGLPGLTGGTGDIQYGMGGLGARGAGPGGGGMVVLAPMASQSMEAKKMESPVARMAEMEGAMADAAAAPPPDPSPTTPMTVRSNFDALALWAPSVRTDGAGRATVSLDLPDSLTRYRVMVVAVAGEDRFGAGEADVTARLPLMVRPSPPRFLNFGDTFSFPVVLQNQTDQPMTVDVAARAVNLRLDPGASGGRRVLVPANDRVEVLFPAAAEQAGTARWQVAAQSGARADAASGSLPVWTPASTEAFATYGTVTDALVVQPVTAPTGVWTEFGGLELTTSSTQLQALTDAVIYLAEYPYGCSEQISSRVLGVAALRDVLKAFSAEGLPSPEALETAVRGDLALLQRRQNADGGFGFWRRDERSWPYLSLHVTHALVRAREKGFEPDPAMLARALDYAGVIQRHLPRWYSEESKRSLRAYAVYVRELAGKDPIAEANALAGLDLPLEAQGWILPTLHRAKSPKAAALLAGWGNLVTESAGTAHFVTGYADGAEVLLHSDRRVDGVLLEALLRVRPDDALVPKLVAGLLAHRTAGRWQNTNESAFVLLALDRYFRVYEGVTPDFVARAWLGGEYAGDHAFRGRTTERAELRVPMAALEGTEDLVLQRDGAGRLYYRIGLRYAPKDLVLPPADRGFTVQRRYEAVDHPGDVRREADGTWYVKAGARVKVHVEMATPMRRYHVALVDPLPAGFEVLNPALRGTGALPEDPTQVTGPWWWWSRPWYDHENLRDERVEAFAPLLWDGVWAYDYFARATTPGTFVVPPAKAEEMYMPETFGRSGGDRVVVE